MSTIVIQLTEWYPGDLKPVCKGVYQREYIFYRYSTMPLTMYYYSMFDGVSWCGGSKDVNVAANCRLYSDKQTLRWRGLNARPTN